MNNCEECDKKIDCSKPCDWLTNQLEKVEIKQAHLLVGNLEAIEKIQAQKKIGRRHSHHKDRDQDIEGT